jgi:hypothetical protein
VWNNVGVLGTVSDLLDTLGHVTSADITVSADSPEGTGGPASTDATRLMHDNIYSVPGSTWSVSLSGLANGLYDVYLYDPMNMFLGTGSGSVNGVTFASINGNFAGTFTRGANYLLLTEIVVANGLLSASGGEAGALAGLAGLQLVEKKVTPEAVPEPGTLMLLGAAFTCLGVGSRRKISGSRRSAYPRK